MEQKIESGGRYEIDPKTCVRTLVEEPTKPVGATNEEAPAATDKKGGKK